MAFSLLFCPLMAILPYTLTQTAALAQGKTFLQSTGLNVTAKISSSRFVTITVASASEFIWGFKEMQLNGQNGYAGCFIWLLSLRNADLQSNQRTPARKLSQLHSSRLLLVQK